MSSESAVAAGGGVESPRASGSAIEGGVVWVPIPIRDGSCSEEGVGDTSFVLLRKLLHFSAAEGDTEEGSRCATTISFSGVGNELSGCGCWDIEGELETRDAIAGERSDRSANLGRGETEETANAVDIVEDGAEIGAEGGGGMRRCSSKTARMRCKKQGKKKETYPADLNELNQSHHPRVFLQFQQRFSIACH